MAPIVLADLHNRDADGRVRLNAPVTVADLARQGLAPDVGLSLVLYCGGTPTKPGQSLAATVEYNAHEGIWVASADELGDSDPVAVADGMIHGHV